MVQWFTWKCSFFLFEPPSGSSVETSSAGVGFVGQLLRHRTTLIQARLNMCVVRWRISEPTTSRPSGNSTRSETRRVLVFDDTLLLVIRCSGVDEQQPAWWRDGGSGQQLYHCKTLMRTRLSPWAFNSDLLVTRYTAAGLSVASATSRVNLNHGKPLDSFAWTVPRILHPAIYFWHTVFAHVRVTGLEVSGCSFSSLS
jgi:hypothetical protein